MVGARGFEPNQDLLAPVRASCKNKKILRTAKQEIEALAESLRVLDGCVARNGSLVSPPRLFICRVAALSVASAPSASVRSESPDHGPNRWRYSPELMNALTISALIKLPLN